MSKRFKFLIGLASALAAGVVSHWPLGQGEAFANELEALLQPVLDERARVPGVTARVQREPLSRTILLSGPADCFQRNGLDGSGGIDELMLSMRGVGRVEWTNPAPEGECR